MINKKSNFYFGMFGTEIHCLWLKKHCTAYSIPMIHCSWNHQKVNKSIKLSPSYPNKTYIYHLSIIFKNKKEGGRKEKCCKHLKLKQQVCFFSTKASKKIHSFLPQNHKKTLLLPFHSPLKTTCAISMFCDTCCCAPWLCLWFKGNKTRQ